MVHIGESHLQETRPTVRGRAAATIAATTTATTTKSVSLNALSSSTKPSRKRQSQGNLNEEPPAKRSRQKRKTKED